MCILLFAYDVHANYSLVVAANRDEFYQRPTSSAQFWSDAEEIFAGRDLQAGGTWLGISKTGRFAGLTNIREQPQIPTKSSLSRGLLVSTYLRETISPKAYLEAIYPTMMDYPGFNLLVGDHQELWYLANRGQAPPQRLGPGIYGLSNHLLNSPWPKVTWGRETLKSLLDTPMHSEKIFAMLGRAEYFADDQLPDTGVGLAHERMLSPLFIQSKLYGTCCSTLITADRTGVVQFYERDTNPLHPPSLDVNVQFMVQPYGL